MTFSKLRDQKDSKLTDISYFECWGIYCSLWNGLTELDLALFSVNRALFFALLLFQGIKSMEIWKYVLHLIRCCDYYGWKYDLWHTINLMDCEIWWGLIDFFLFLHSNWNENSQWSSAGEWLIYGDSAHFADICLFMKNSGHSFPFHVH